MRRTPLPPPCFSLPASANLITNGGFETGNTKGWSSWPTSGLTPNVLKDGNAKEGTRCYRVQLDNTVNNALLIQDLTTKGMAEGDTIRFSAWFKTGNDVNSGATCNLLSCWGTDGALDPYTYGTLASNTGPEATWKQLSADFTVLALPYNFLRIYLENQNFANGPATFYWDDIQLNNNTPGGGGDPFISLVYLDGATITIKPGKFHTAAGDIDVKTTATFASDAGELNTVTDEPVLLSTTPPSGWSKGTKLQGPNARDINAGGSFINGSLIMRTAPNGGGRLLTQGVDYLLSPEFAMVGLAPGSPLNPNVPVYATYRYGLLRIDSVTVDAAGHPHFLRGTSNITIPLPPIPTAGTLPLLNVFRPYHAMWLDRADIYPVQERSDQVVTHSTAGRIPKTLNKLKNGQQVRIVCLGDSVTAGGNASTPDKKFSEVFKQKLQAKYSPSLIDLHNISVGGSGSVMWLSGTLRTNFQQILDLHPDLVTIEFVNDSYLSQGGVQSQYTQLMTELQGVGAEIILITPHFTALTPMGASDLRTNETRPYVQYIQDFANQNHLGIADASSRWAHLWKEGIPYITELDNSFNHPDDRGHLMFAEELMKNFEPANTSVSFWEYK